MINSWMIIVVNRNVKFNSNKYHEIKYHEINLTTMDGSLVSGISITSDCAYSVPIKGNSEDQFVI